MSCQIFGVQEEFVQQTFVLNGHVHCIFRVVERVFPRVQQKRKPQLGGRLLLQCLLDGDEVLKRFRHLASGNGEMAGVKEVLNPIG